MLFGVPSVLGRGWEGREGEVRGVKLSLATPGGQVTLPLLAEGLLGRKGP